MCKISDKEKQLEKAQKGALLSYAELLATVINEVKKSEKIFSVKKQILHLTPAG